MMHGITLWRPWPVAVVHANKSVENRTWPPPPWLIGGAVALHAGKTIDHAACDELASAFGVPLGLLPGDVGIIATARVLGYVGPKGEHRGVDALAADVARASRFFSGPYGWILADVVPLAKPVPHRGLPGIWAVDVRAADEITADRGATRKRAPAGP